MKYMGSKNRIAKDIVPILEKAYYDNECEIFIDVCCGGCNLIDKINQNIPRYANDLNEYLIEMWRGIQSGVEYPTKIDKDLYNIARGNFNDKNYGSSMTLGLIGWIGFMASYNGRFFDGGYSGHNVQIKGNKNRDYITENINNILKQKELVKDVIFTNKSLFDISPNKKSLIYFDIPYKNTKQYSISKNFNYEEFYKKCFELKQQGHVIFISEYSMPKEFRLVWGKEIKTHMNQKAEDRTEKLFTL